MVCVLLFFFKQKTAYEMRISDWSSYVCSSDLVANHSTGASRSPHRIATKQPPQTAVIQSMRAGRGRESGRGASSCISAQRPARCARPNASSTTRASGGGTARSEEHTSELQSLMRISYAVFCLKKKTHQHYSPITHASLIQLL